MTCKDCIYLSQGRTYIYCEMRNRMLESVEAPICDKWKKRPQKRYEPERTTDWVQIGMKIDK